MEKTCWILTDGKAGTERQCIGLAEGLSLKPVIKRVSPKFPWSFLPPALWFFPLHGVRGLKKQEEWPDVLIAGGRSAAALAKEIKRLSFGKTFTIFLQNPYISPKNFDVVVAPAHDGLKGDNLIETLGALHCVNNKELEEASKKYKSLFQELPSKKAAVLLGGVTRHYDMTPDLMQEYGSQLRILSKRTGVGYMVTASRRTEEACLSAFRKGLGASPVFVWNGKGDNPYMGFLSQSDIIVVTSDSVSMISEAIFTGKPVYLLMLRGRSKRLDAFHKTLFNKGYARPFEKNLESWAYEPVDEMKRVVKKIYELGF